MGLASRSTHTILWDISEDDMTTLPETKLNLETKLKPACRGQTSCLNWLRRGTLMRRECPRASGAVETLLKPPDQRKAKTKRDEPRQHAVMLHAHFRVGLFRLFNGGWRSLFQALYRHLLETNRMCPLGKHLWASEKVILLSRIIIKLYFIISSNTPTLFNFYLI